MKLHVHVAVEVSGFHTGFLLGGGGGKLGHACPLKEVLLL